MYRIFGIAIIIVSLGMVFGLGRTNDDALELTVPIEGMKGKIGKCQIDVLDPEDNVVGSIYRYLFVTKDYYTFKIKVGLKQTPADRDLLRIRVQFKNSQTIYSLFQLHDRIVVKILGQDEFIKGTAINYRIIATNQRNNEPLKGARVKIGLVVDDSVKPLFEGETDGAGSCTSEFSLPDTLDKAELSFKIASDIGEDEYRNVIKLTSGNLTYLVTDKPIYQPGQTMHIRTLSLHRPDLVAVKGRNLTFEVEDSKGNKVFKKTAKTDDFGSGYAQFAIADEVNHGDYTIRAVLDKEKVEKTVKVEKYVLPKFRIGLKTGKEFYMPGESMEGDVDVQYFFGKAVADARVVITTYRFDIGFQKEAVIEGRTDKDGKYHFVYTLPGYFVGEPLEKGDAFMRFDLEVIDKANHSEKLSIKKKIVRDLLSISIVPEGGVLRPGLENRIFVLVNYPDGTPCLAQVEMTIAGQSMAAKTDDFGIAEFLYKPKDAAVEIQVRAMDDKGEKAGLTKEFSLDVGRDQIIMKMGRGIYRVGESVNLQFMTTRRFGRVYLDVIKDNQTIITRSVAINNGRANYKLNLTPDLAGSIWLHAYTVTPGSDIVRDTRFCYVHPANDLTISIKPDQAEYLPGAEGNLLFQVTGRNGQPRVAALCVAIVDEAVFAVSELHPGLEKVYFTLEKEILEPRYEIHGFQPEDIVKKEGIQPRAENVMFSTLTPKDPFPVNYTTPQDINDKVVSAFYERLAKVREEINEALNQYYGKHNAYPKTKGGIDTLIQEGLLKEKDLLDPWARRYQITTSGDYLSWFNISSAGPDGIHGNGDDITEWGRGWKFEGLNEMEADFALPKAGVLRAGSAMAPVEERPVKTKRDGGKPGEEPRVREFFPETFIFEPALITDDRGEARISLTMPDAITTWRVTSFASSQKGELGSNLSEIRVFQDFFVDIDLPVALVQGDEISIPIALYNYLPRQQEIRVVLQSEDWFDILESNEITKKLKKDEVSVIYFPIRVKKIGYYSILVKAYGEEKSDAVKRMITILPDGKRFEEIISDRLQGTVKKDVKFPGNAIKDANTLTLKLYPGIYTQIVEGLDRLFQMPFGCFEQTTSVTYPNILILDYLRQTEQVKPDIEMKAEEYISLGYQRLLSFEVAGGGFSWFGDAPANKVLTAYGLMEFKDMARVYEIDERVITRTAQWLKDQQNKDGSWSPDAQYLHAESWTRIQHSEILPTAYICWALGESGERGTAVSKAIEFLKDNMKSVNDPYVLALIANALVAVEPNGTTTMEVLKRLVGMAKEGDDAIYWETGVPSITFSRGSGADIEATGLAAYALIKSGRFADIVTKALTYLIRNKDSNGLWYTTQGTIIALRCMVSALATAAEDIDAQITVRLNGKEIKRLKIDKDNSDLMHQIDLEGFGDRNSVEISLVGEGNFLYEIVQAYYIPWKELARPEKPPFLIKVDYDRTNLSINDIVDVRVMVSLERPGKAQMVMVDLGLPPGFEVQTPTLDELVGKKIQKYSVTARQLIIYLDEVSFKEPVKFTYSIKAKYPIKAKVRSSRVYEYYNTWEEGVEEPIEMKVSQ